MTNSPLDAAPQLIEAGLAIVPLLPGQKRPNGWLAQRGAHSATRDLDVVARWQKEEPLSNVGVSTAGLAVIDVDPRNGGGVTFSKLPQVPSTWRSRTGGGGWHHWFRLPDGIQLSGGTDRLGRGVDLKTGRGSFVVAPPSRTAGPYRWLPGHAPGEIELAKTPDWIIQRLTPPPPRPQNPFRPRTNDDQRIAKALSCIPADDRQVWISVGRALKSHFGEGGRELWNRWSSSSEKFDQHT
jgi:hypothetical protein